MVHITTVHIFGIMCWRAGRPCPHSPLWPCRFRASVAQGRGWHRWGCARLTLLSQPPPRSACSVQQPGRVLTISLTKSGTNLLPYVQVGLGSLFFLGQFCIFLDEVLERPQISWSALASPNHTENKQKTSYLFSPRDQENTILGEQAMCLRTLLLNTWMFTLLEPSPFPLMLLK